MTRPSLAVLRSIRIPTAIAFVACLLVGAGSPALAGNLSARAAASHVSALASASCSNVKTGGTLVYGVDQDVVSFDAMNTQDNGSLWADQNIYDQLVRSRRTRPSWSPTWRNRGKSPTAARPTPSTSATTRSSTTAIRSPRQMSHGRTIGFASPRRSTRGR